MNVSTKGEIDVHKDKRALAATLRKYQRHILGPLFVEAADAIEELLKCCDALERDNDSLCATIEQQKAEIITMTGQQDEPCEDCKIGGNYEL